LFFCKKGYYRGIEMYKVYYIGNNSYLSKHTQVSVFLTLHGTRSIIYYRITNPFVGFCFCLLHRFFKEYRSIKFTKKQKLNVNLFF
jgi:hypothetical protein